MVKYLVLMVNFSVTLFLNFLFQTPVDVGINVPTTVTAGESFEVNVTLNKNNISGFARYQQQLPYGLSAVSDQNANADFTFKDQKVRLIWLRLPEDEENVTFTYRILIDKRLKGDFNFEGIFSYIENNDRKSASSISPVITILPSPDISPDEIVDISEFGNAVIQNLTPKKRENVMCFRQVPQLTDTKDGFLVNVIVHKGSERFAKIEENIPDGYVAVALETKEAIFSSRDNVVKFLWMNLPGDEYFNVSYKLVPTGALTKDVSINGTFSYIEDDDKTTVVDIVQESFELTDFTSEKIGEVFTRLITGEHFASTNQNVQNTDGNEIKADQIKTEGDNTTNKVPSLLGDNTKKPDVKTIQKTVKNTAGKYVGRSDLLTPETGIYYRVQVAAGRNPVNIKRYFRKFNLEKAVKKEEHEGWIKYSVGSFNQYKEARDYRNYVWRTTLIDDAFVSAYNAGNRITVQEALMVANQSWYK